jgi:hypothetical protein
MTDGFDALDEIASVRTNAMDKPLDEQKMAKVVIED